MVLLTFTNASTEKILDGRKCATTRPLTKHWHGVVRKFRAGQPLELQVYNRSPRNGGRLLFEVEAVRADPVFGADYDAEMFLKDGFQNSADLVAGLAAFYDPRFCNEDRRYELRSHFDSQRKSGHAHKMGPRLKEDEAAHWFDRASWAFIEFPTPIRVTARKADQLEQASA